MKKCVANAQHRNIINKMRGYFLFFTLITTNLSLLPLLYFANPKQLSITFIVYFVTGCFGMSLTYHRLLSHKSWEAPNWFYYFGSFAGTVGLTGSPLAWVAIHREHHLHTDTRKDPHSPLFKGIFTAQYLTMFPQPKMNYVKDLLAMPLQKFIHRNYWPIQIFWIAILFFFDPFAIVYGYLAPAALLWNTGSAINTINHKFGYINHKLENNSKNNLLLGFLAWGEGWHNNHHANPKAWYFGERKYEFDIGGFFIKLLKS